MLWSTWKVFISRHLGSLLRVGGRLNDLNYHHLRYFWVVARRGSISAACEELHVAQPTVSAQLRTLEQSLGEKLFRKQGRGLVLTEVGQTTFEYAEEIFSLGRELVQTLGQHPTGRRTRLKVGLSDAVPKLVAAVILEPLIKPTPSVELVVREGKPAELLSSLATHRLDVVIADEPASSATAVRAYSHELGESTVTFAALPNLAAQLRPGFPESLSGAPAVLPAGDAPLRRAVERWFKENKVVPMVSAECDDSAFANVLAGRGVGFVPVPTVVASDVHATFGLEAIGEARSCRERFFAISIERRLTNPAVVEITSQARHGLFPAIV